MTTVHRCSWAENDLLMQAYHDEEWGVPEYDSRALWEKLMLDGFQAGLSWSIILRKRDAFRKAFKNFDPEAVACFREADVVRLLKNPGIVRSAPRSRRPSAALAPISRCKPRERSFRTSSGTGWAGSRFRTAAMCPPRLRSPKRYPKALKKRGFKFVGPVIVYAWMQAVGIVNDHAANCFRRKTVRANRRH